MSDLSDNDALDLANGVLSISPSETSDDVFRCLHHRRRSSHEHRRPRQEDEVGYTAGKHRNREWQQSQKEIQVQQEKNENKNYVNTQTTNAEHTKTTTPFHLENAVMSQDVHSVRNLLAQLFKNACLKEDLANIDLLLNTPGAVDVNALHYHQDGRGQTLLHVACYHKLHKVVQMLISKGKANVNTLDDHGQNAMFQALHPKNNGKPDKGTMRLLLQSGADPNSANAKGEHLIQLACQEGHHDVMDMLLDNGARILRVTNDHGQTLLHQLCLQARLDTLGVVLPQILKLLMELENQVLSSPRGKIHQDEEPLRFVRDYRDETDEDGNTALHLLARGGHQCCEIALELIDQGANTTITNKKGEIPLHLFARHAFDDDRISVVRILGRESDAVLSQDCEGNLPLHHYCMGLKGDDTEEALEIVEYLGDNVNMANKQGRTPLHIICSGVRLEKSIEIATYFLEEGANFEAKDSLGFTPLMLCCHSFPSGQQKLAVIKLLLSYGANAMATSGHMTPLLLACAAPRCNSGSPKVTETILETLIENGADVEAGSCEAKPLHVACRNGNSQAVVCLLKHGANPRAVIRGGNTPLHTLFMNKTFKKSEARNTCDASHMDEIVTGLLRHGANPVAPNDKGEISLSIAVFQAKCGLGALYTLFRSSPMSSIQFCLSIENGPE